MKTGIAHLPLHGGKAPRWLFEKMVLLSGAILDLMVMDMGPEEVLKYLSNPFWFQAFGCVLGFDWHSSGLTTTTCGAVKEALKKRGPALGLYVAGGKGKTSRKTPDEITAVCDTVGYSHGDHLVQTSRLVAKVDSAGIQDGYQLYHHSFFFTRTGKWAVIQQGMHTQKRYARRYHWLSDAVTSFVDEPHKAILSPQRQETILNLIAHQSEASRNAMVTLSKQPPDKLTREIKKIDTLSLPRHHPVYAEAFRPGHLEKTLLKTYEVPPEDFEKLLLTRGLGPKTLRALALLSEVMFGKPPSFEEPAVFSFAHGGKDGHPYPVDMETYQNSIDILNRTIQQARLGRSDKIRSLKALANFMKRNPAPSGESRSSSFSSAY
ncbi:MAG: DUF763 domain-containing protein [Deltaproteobacteria bacterium]|nr:MAG: DUF763 domain-containing protein [Deltaproteobacteria bacterium]